MKELYKIQFQLDNQNQSKFPTNEKRDNFNKKIPKHEGADERFKYWGNVFKEREAQQKKQQDLNEERLKEEMKQKEEKLAQELKLSIPPQYIAELEPKSPTVDMHNRHGNNKCALKSQRSNARGFQIEEISMNNPLHAKESSFAEKTSPTNNQDMNRLDTHNSMKLNDKMSEQEKKFQYFKKVSIIVNKKIELSIW